MDETRHDCPPSPAALVVAFLLGACGDKSALQFEPPPPEPPEPGVPLVAGPARYEDRNRNHKADARDVLIVPFSKNVDLNGALVGDFALTATDSFGTTPALVDGPAANEITITLDDGASLKTRQGYDPDSGDTDPASGVQLVSGAGIMNPVDGSRADASALIDIVPGFVEGGALANNSTRAVLLLDVDGDADLDLLVGNAEGEADELWRNDGTGRFLIRQLFGASDTFAFAAGDLDGDGDPDLVVADGLAPNTVWENDEGFFILPKTIDDVCSDTGGCPTLDVALADVNNDGDLDLVEGNWNEPNLLQENEGGTLSGSIEVGLGATSCVAFGDLDLDGDPDLVVGGDSDGDQVWINVNGNFVVDPLQRLGLGATSSVALGHLDLDGDPDLVVGDGGAGDQVWINLHGSFVDSGQRLGSGATSDVALADFDQDGALDLVAAVRGGGNRFWLNDRSGTFVDSRQILGAAPTQSLAVGDVDGDGDLDLVAGNDGAANQVFLGSLTGTWGEFSLNPVDLNLAELTDSNAVSSADLDQDGDVDFVVSTSTRTAIIRNVEDGILGSLVLPQLSISESNALGDIDGDGAIDLMEGIGGANDRQWRNVDGTFPASVDLETGTAKRSIAVALVDVDSDGRLEYVQPCSTTTGIRIWSDPDRDGIFSSAVSLGNPKASKALAVGDVNGDGLPDLVEAYFETNVKARTWQNRGASYVVTQDNMSIGTGDVRVGLSLGDLDADGDLDLVSTGPQGMKLWSNELGTFARETVVDTLSFDAVVLADLQGDGAMDIIAGGRSGSPIKPWLYINRNDPNNPFTFDATEVSLSQAAELRALAGADVDRDGDVDFFAAFVGTREQVWFNR